MQIYVGKNTEDMGQKAAADAAALLRETIAKKGEARLALSTGASQFEALAALVNEDVDWTKVTMFHLDEYVQLPESHPASFRKYLKERFVSKVPLKKAYFVNGEADTAETIAALTEAITAAPVDVGLIGIGENAHVAFNDPPADFDTKASYIVVNLDHRCRLQQVGEGWFATEANVPKQAISMTVSQIMRCEHILTIVPHDVKADAIRKTLTAAEVTPMVPASVLRTHTDWRLYLDADSAKDTPPEVLAHPAGLPKR